MVGGKRGKERKLEAVGIRRTDDRTDDEDEKEIRRRIEARVKVFRLEMYFLIIASFPQSE